MNPELPPSPRDEIEAKVTALLLGELAPEEAASVREMIAKDAALARLRDRLSLTLDLLRETAARPVADASAQPAPRKLSPARREKLLAHFKTIAPKEFARTPRRKLSWLVPLAAAASLAALLTVVIVPSFVKARTASLKNSVVNNLRMLDSAKNQWALEQRKASTDVPTLQDLQPYAGRGSSGELLEPVSGGVRYFVGPVGRAPFAVTEIGGKKTVIDLPGVKSDPEALALNKAAAVAAPQPAPPPIANLMRKAQRGPPPVPARVQIALPQSEPQLAQANQQPNEQSVSLLNGAVESVKPLFGGGAGRPISESESKEALPPMAAAPTGPAPLGSTAEGAPGSAFKSESASVAPIGGVIERLRQRRDEQETGQRSEFRDNPGDVTGAVATASPYVDKDSRKLVEGFVPQAQAVTGSTIGVPVQAQAPTLGDKPLAGPLFGSTRPIANGTIGLQGGTAPVQQVAQLDERGAINIRGAGLIVDSVQQAAPVADLPAPRAPAIEPAAPQPEIQTASNAFSTFSLNVSDVAFKLAAASLQNGVMPETASIRSEEFINAFDYRDPEPAPGAPIGFAWERAADPFAHNRDLLRFSIKTAAQGREAGRPLNLVLLLDKSGSMERADRVEIVSEALRVLATQLQPQDTLSVVVFARTARLWVDGVPGSQAGAVANDLRSLTPEGGTNLEEAMKLAYATALRHYLAEGENRVVLLTDGAANLGNVDPAALQQNVETNRKQGIAFDCFGVGWEGYNDDLLATLSRAGNGRYAFINTPEEATNEFAGKLAGALRVAAADVKVQVEFNSNRVTSYRQIGYAKHQLAKEQFRDNSVTAAQIGAAESGNALYTVEINPAGDGPLGTVHVRFRLPGTADYQEHEWTLAYTGGAAPLDKASAAMRLAATAAAFSEWLAGSPYAAEVTPDQLLGYLSGVPRAYGADTRPARLEWMIRQAKSISGK